MDCTFIHRHPEVSKISASCLPYFSLLIVHSDACVAGAMLAESSSNRSGNFKIAIETLFVLIEENTNENKKMNRVLSRQLLIFPPSKDYHAQTNCNLLARIRLLSFHNFINKRLSISIRARFIEIQVCAIFGAQNNAKKICVFRIAIILIRMAFELLSLFYSVSTEFRRLFFWFVATIMSLTRSSWFVLWSEASI